MNTKTVLMSMTLSVVTAVLSAYFVSKISATNDNTNVKK